MKKPIFAMIPSGYKASTFYTPIPIDGSGDFAFTRSTVATRVNKDGLIEEVAANVPRLDYRDSNCPSLLIEPATTNQVDYSQPTAGGQGWATNGTPVVTYLSDIAPDGTKTAQRYETNANGEGKFLQTEQPFTIGEFVTASFFVKHISGNPLLKINIAGTSVGTVKNFYYNIEEGFVNEIQDLATQASVEDYGNGWFRIIATAEATATGVARSTIYSSGDDPATWLWWGAQLEASRVVTSYVKTTGAEALRNRDLFGDTLNAEILKNVNTEGSLYFHFKPLNDGIPFKGIELADGSNGHRILLRQDGDNSYTVYYQVVGITKTSLAFPLDPTIQYHKVVVVWKQGTIQVYLNGVLVNENLTFDLTGVSPFTLLTLSGGGGGQYWNGSAKELMVFNEYLTEAEAIELTTI